VPKVELSLVGNRQEVVRFLDALGHFIIKTQVVRYKIGLPGRLADVGPALDGTVTAGKLIGED
jgi:hypothetical protein